MMIKMDDLISRKAAVDALDRFSLGETDTVKLAFRMGDYLKRLPSAQPERPTGRWYKPKEFPKKTYRRICTACQDVAYFCGEGNYRYCPNCGAKMEVEHETD